MALDAIITATRPHAEGIEIELGPRPAGEYMSQGGELAYSPASIPGQDKMVIVNPTWTPHVGDQLWGGSRSAVLESGGISFPYKRQGYTRLVQDWQ